MGDKFRRINVVEYEPIPFSDRAVPLKEYQVQIEEYRVYTTGGRFEPEGRPLSLAKTPEQACDAAIAQLTEWIEALKAEKRRALDAHSKKKPSRKSQKANLNG